MLLKNENDINRDICQSIYDAAKDKDGSRFLYYLNEAEILSHRVLNLKELKNAEHNKFFDSRKEYINAIGIIADVVEIDVGDKTTSIDFHVSDRLNAKTKIGWEYADAIKTLTNKQYFKEDFKTIKNFSRVTDLEQPFISKMRAASSFKEEHLDIQETKIIDVYRASVLSRLGWMLDAFVRAYGGYERISDIPLNQLEKEVSDYKRDDLPI